MGGSNEVQERETGWTGCSEFASFIPGVRVLVQSKHDVHRRRCCDCWVHFQFAEEFLGVG